MRIMKMSMVCLALMVQISCQKQDLRVKSLQVDGLAMSSNEIGSKLNSGLVAYYPFSGNANDATNHGYNGVVYGATLTTDRFNKAKAAYSFSGLSSPDGLVSIVDNSIQVPNFNYNFGNKMSVSVWVNISSTVGSAGDRNGPFLDRRTDNAIDFACLHYNSSPYGHFGALGAAVGTRTAAVDTWHNYIYTYDGAALRVYLDGLLDAQVATTGNIGNNTSIMDMGKYVYHGGATYYQYFNGKLDDIRIYNRALTSQEITYLAAH